MERFRIAFLQEAGNGRLGHEEQLLFSELGRRGIPVSFFTPKKILRRSGGLGLALASTSAFFVLAAFLIQLMPETRS